MDYEILGYPQSEILLSHKEEQKYVIFRKMDGIREYYAKRYWPVTENEGSYVFFHMWKLGSSRDTRGTSNNGGETPVEPGR